MLASSFEKGLHVLSPATIYRSSRYHNDGLVLRAVPLAARKPDHGVSFVKYDYNNTVNSYKPHEGEHFELSG